MSKGQVCILNTLTHKIHKEIPYDTSNFIILITIYGKSVLIISQMLPGPKDMYVRHFLVFLFGNLLGCFLVIRIFFNEIRYAVFKETGIAELIAVIICLNNQMYLQIPVTLK